METQKQSRDNSSSNQTTSHRFEEQLKDVIVSHLDLLSQDGKEKVHEYINALIDMEERRNEFNRRQGLLYNWGSDDSRA
ncbi:MAG: hypothetical protein U0V70_13175 [Terriglobia bacterium]